MPILDLIEAGGGTAIVAPGGGRLTFSDLRRHIEATRRALRSAGIGPGDPVAVVLPNGPDLATAFLAVAGAAVFAPLNPAYRRTEFEFLLRDLGARLLVTEAGFAPAAAEAAAELGVPIAAARRSGSAPGAFQLDFGAVLPRAPLPAPELPPSTALVLHTSGTTSRPKLVPLTGQNLCASARNIARSLGLGPEDRCLSIMPLFHIHGLMAGLLAPLCAGGSVFCVPGFNAHRFGAWLTESRTTWFTAVPAMHQAVLPRAGASREPRAAHRLRLVRSCSSALAPVLWRRLESAYSAPVVNAYGMTEASHQISSMPLPPAPSKMGTVGTSGECRAAIMDASGMLQPPGTEGEVVIRGPAVTPGYAGNPDANRAAFVNGWFRTGDRGRLDADGYLTLTGRIKELINCGGEKISPPEIDEALLEHPAVASAVAFALPHAQLGECVAAAVVLVPGARATPADLRDFVRARVAKFKVPRRILLVDRIPAGPTGKPQRIGLAARLGLEPSE